MRALEIIELDHYYHIYNRGINGEDLYYSDNNYMYFLKLYKKYISPIIETYAWCLMKNHFHFLIKIKSEKELLELYNSDIEKIRKKPSQQLSNFFNAYAQAINKQNNRHGSLFEKPFRRKKNKKFLEIDYPRGRAIEVFRRFHFALKGKNRNFVFYLTQNFLFWKFRPLPRRGKSETPRQSHRGIFLIKDKKYFVNLILYIHNNPVNHSVTNSIEEYKWSLFNAFIGDKKTALKRSEVLNLFDGRDNFIETHKQRVDVINIEKWLKI